MSDIKLYTENQMKECFRAGVKRGSAESLPGMEIAKGEIEYLSSINHVRVKKTYFDIAVGRTTQDENQWLMAPTAKAIIESVGEAALDINAYELVNPTTQEPKYVIPRHVAYFLMFCFTNHTYRGMGRFFKAGGNHANVIKGARNVYFGQHRPPYRNILNDSKEILIRDGYDMSAFRREPERLLPKAEREDVVNISIPKSEIKVIQP